MNRNSVSPLVLLLVFFAGSFSVDAGAADQVWLENSISLNTHNSTEIAFTQVSRYSTFTLFNDHYLSAYFLTVTYRLSPSYYSAFGFRRQDTELETFTSHENRVYMQGGRKQRLVERLMLDTRGRIEYRSFREPLFDDYFRFRIRFKLILDMQPAGVKLQPFISEELFADDREGGREFLNRNRIIAGLNVAIGEHAGCEMSYMLNNDRDTKPLTALVAGIQIKL